MLAYAVGEHKPEVIGVTWAPHKAAAEGTQGVSPRSQHVAYGSKTHLGTSRGATVEDASVMSSASLRRGSESERNGRPQLERQGRPSKDGAAKDIHVWQRRKREKNDETRAKNSCASTQKLPL